MLKYEKKQIYHKIFIFIVIKKKTAQETKLYLKAK